MATGGQQPKWLICLLNINCSISYVTLDHKNSHEVQFTEIEIYTLYSYGSWINKFSIDVWCVRLRQYLAEKQLFETSEL